nr:MAG TPA: hypothetical protein [Caudoviricetes sp.]
MVKTPSQPTGDDEPVLVGLEKCYLPAQRRALFLEVACLQMIWLLNMVLISPKIYWSSFHLKKRQTLFVKVFALRFATSWNMNTMTVFLLLKKRHLIGNHGQTVTNAMRLVLPER